MRAVLLSAAMLSYTAACRAPVDSASKPIFRSIATNIGSIALDQPWVVVPGAAADSGDTVIALPENAFAGAQAIRVHRSPEGIVRSIHFDYPQSTDYDALMAVYTRSLGTPAQRKKAADGVAADRAAWEDAATRFELVRDPARNASTVYSVLMSTRSTGR